MPRLLLALTLLGCLFLVAAVFAQPDPSLACDSRPCIQVGSFNIKYLGNSDRSLRETRDLADLITVPDSGPGSYLPGGGNDLIDHIWINFPETQEVVRNSGSVFVPEDEDDFMASMSDHAPVWATFATDLDADQQEQED